MSDYKKEFDKLVEDVWDHILNEGRKQSKTNRTPDPEINQFIQREIERFRGKLSSRLKVMLTAQLEIVEAMLKNPPTPPEDRE